MYIYIYMYILYEQPHLFTEEKSSLQGTAFWGPELALSGKPDRNRTSNEINAYHRSCWFKARTRLNATSQHFEHHIHEDS